jgi:NAD(P)-dependent dehydrogenase (short-subunit alcohol dehydrogenase family)
MRSNGRVAQDDGPGSGVASACDPEGYYREVAKRVPVGRVGEAAEFADLAAFLCSAGAPT